MRQRRDREQHQHNRDDIAAPLAHILIQTVHGLGGCSVGWHGLVSSQLPTRIAIQFPKHMPTAYFHMVRVTAAPPAPLTQIRQPAGAGHLALMGPRRPQQQRL